MHFFLPHCDCSIRVSQPCDFTFFWFLFCNFVVVTPLCFKSTKGTVTMVNPIFKLFPCVVDITPWIFISKLST